MYDVGFPLGKLISSHRNIPSPNCHGHVVAVLVKEVASKTRPYVCDEHGASILFNDSDCAAWIWIKAKGNLLWYSFCFWSMANSFNNGLVNWLINGWIMVDWRLVHWLTHHVFSFSYWQRPHWCRRIGSTWCRAGTALGEGISGSLGLCGADGCSCGGRERVLSTGALTAVPQQLGRADLWRLESGPLRKRP